MNVNVLTNNKSASIRVIRTKKLLCNLCPSCLEQVRRIHAEEVLQGDTIRSYGI